MLRDEMRTKQTLNLAVIEKDEILDKSPPKKKKASMFDLIKTVNQTSVPTVRSYNDELDEYFNTEILKENESPLQFWQRNESRFPILSSFASIYLAIPATSGSVERLFSVAACIARARRARLLIENLEKILCIQQQMINTN